MAGSNEELCPDVPDDELREQLAACREDWQRVCDALGAKGEHMDPDGVVRTIAALAPAQEPAGGGEHRTEHDKVSRDAMLYGFGFMVDGKHVPTDRVMVATPTPQAEPAGGGEWQYESMRHLAYLLRNMSPVGFSAEVCSDAASWLEKLSRKPATPTPQAAGAAPEGWPFGEEHGAEVMVCQIGDYKAVEPREMATVIFDGKKVAECYTNEDAELVGRALRMLAASPQPPAQEQSA